MTRTLTLAAAIGALLFGLPSQADAQRVQIDVKASAELSQQLRAALRDATREIGEAVRDLTRDVSRDLPRELEQGLGQLDRELGRSLGNSLKGLNDIGRFGAYDGGWRLAQDRNWNGRAEDRQTRTFAIGPTGTLELRNLSGDITVTAGTGSNVTIDVIRRSRGRTDADARVGLDRVKVTQQASGTNATLRTDYPNERQPAYSVSVELVVSAPPGTRLIINSVSANLKVTGIRGELSAKTMSGDLALTNVGAVSEAKTASGNVLITGATGDISLDAGTLNGDVVLKQVKARRIAASSVSGNVSATEVACESATLTTMAGDASFSGDLARNGRYEISSHSGDVRFTPSSKVGFTLTASSFNGDINSSMPLQGDSSRTRRRSMSGKVGDGSATVSLQTFSGDITVGAKK